MKNEYYLKMLYFNAGKSLLTSNFVYGKNIMYLPAIKACYNILMNKEKNNMVLFCDKVSAGTHRILHNISISNRSENTVFEYRDDETDNCLCAVFLPDVNKFFYNDRWSIFKYHDHIDCCDFYPFNSNGKYSFDRLVDIAKDYFIKSESIDNC